ncbi:MAG: CDGSH iron-sulfur domain-containing protein [Sulfurovum sp.]|nr:CDGSH iron-sulfur domain-containing protein [Sulfurovum sp.]
MEYPVKIDLIEGQTYMFCTCGKSADFVLCDGCHKGTDFTPQKFVAEKSSPTYLCACKKSKNLPYCDGTHAIREKMSFDFEV